MMLYSSETLACICTVHVLSVRLDLEFEVSNRQESRKMC